MTPTPIEVARRRHSLADVAGRTGVGFARDGQSVTVRCPLPAHGHFDRSPSLRLHLDDGIFFCFGCGQRGDVVEWVCQTEGVDWRAAVRILDSGRALTNAWGSNGQAPDRRDGRPDDALRVGHVRAGEALGRVEHPDLSRTPATRVYEALAAAWEYYSSHRLHERGVRYLASRGIDVRLLETHTQRDEVGHTPASSDGLVTAMQAQGFSVDDLVDAGLAHRHPDGRAADFYRQRVLIPIRDPLGRVRGFVGRNVGDDRWPKYKNPPRTHAYDKSVNLYQPLQAPTNTRSGQVVVVEGTIDAMAIAVGAIECGRADQFCPLTQSGRELSSAQLVRAASMRCRGLVLGFDGDAAGRESSRRHAMTAARLGQAVWVTTLPGDHDPASWFAESGAAALDAWTVAGALNPGRPMPKPIAAATYLSMRVAAAGVCLDPATPSMCCEVSL